MSPRPGEALLSFHLSRRVLRGTPQGCVRLAMPRVPRSELPKACCEESWRSCCLAGNGGTVPVRCDPHKRRLHAPLACTSLEDARQFSHALQGERAATASLAPFTGKKANGVAFAGSVSCSNAFLVHGHLRSRRKEGKQIPSMKPSEFMMCKGLIV